MSGDSAPANAIQRPRYRTKTDLFLWHQYQGEGTNDCAAFSIAIVGNALRNSAQFEGAKIAREMEHVNFIRSPLPHPTLWKIRDGATMPWGISGYLQRQKIPARLRYLASTEQLLRNIQEDRFTIVIIGDLPKGYAHAKVLYGYEPTGPQPQRGFYFVDPGYPMEWSAPRHPRGVFRQDESEFKQHWNNLFRILIEIEP